MPNVRLEGGKPDWHSGHVRVLQALHHNARSTRIELAHLTGLSPQSLTRLTTELIDTDHLTEGARRMGHRGQPAIELSLVKNRLLSIGLVLEHDRITCLTQDLADGSMRRQSAVGDFLHAEATASMAEQLVSEAIAVAPKQAHLLGIGVSQSGFFYKPGTQMVISRNDVTGWMALDLAERLQDRFDLAVTIENDGRAAAVGHTVRGIGTHYNSFFLVLMTRGVGGGAVENRQLVRGQIGNAGEVAMLMPKDPAAVRPTLESLGSWLEDSWGRVPSEADIDAALAAGDLALLAWLDQAAAVLDQALGSVCALLDPEAIILAGRLAPTIRTALAQRLTINTIRFHDILAPSPKIVIDPETNCLEIGAAALPVANFFKLAQAGA